MILRQVLTIAWSNLVRVSRDRLGLFFILVLPLLVILLFGVAGGGGSATAPVGVVVGSPGPLAQDLLDRLDEPDGIRVLTYDDRADLEVAVRRRVVSAGLVLPPDYDKQLRAGESLPVELLVDPAGTVPSAVRTTVTGRLAAENVRVQTAQFATDELDLSFDEALQLADETAAQETTVRAETVGTVTAGPRMLDRSAAANLVLFVFITSLVGSAALIETRRLGVSHRMLAAPTTPARVLAGEALGRFALALVQAAIIIVGASLLFGAQWRDPGAVWVVVAVLSLVGTAGAMLMGARFRNAEQASGVAVPLGIGLGMLGGCMWPLEIVPEPMRVVGRFTPHAWAMDALDGILRQGTGLAGAARPLAVLAGFAALGLAAAVWQFGRVLRSGGTGG